MKKKIKILCQRHESSVGRLEGWYSHFRLSWNHRKSRHTFWITNGDLGCLCHPPSLRNWDIIFLTRILQIKTIVWVFYSRWVVARKGVCKRSLGHSRNRVWNIRETGFAIDDKGSKWNSKILVPVVSISKDLSIYLRSSTECCYAFPLRYENICPISANKQGKITLVTCCYALDCAVHRSRFEDYL